MEFHRCCCARVQVYCTACNTRLCDACDNKRHELSHDVDVRLHKRTRERPRAAARV